MEQTGTDHVLTEAFTRLSGTDRDNAQLAEDMRGPQAEAFRIANIHELTRQDIEVMLLGYEARYGMASDEFAGRWAAGALPDTWEFNDWAMLLRYLRSETANN